MADRRAGGGARGGGQNPVAARPHGPRAEAVQVGQEVNWAQKNPNRTIVEKKVVYTGPTYKSEFTPTKIKNKELQGLYDELYVYHRLISRAPSKEAATESSDEYNRLMERVHQLMIQIKDDNGMPLPLPKKLKKAPRPKAVL